MLLAYNKTTSPLTLAAGSPIVTLPAADSAGSRGAAFNVTSELRGLTNPDYVLLQAQMVAGSVEFEWLGSPEYDTGSLLCSMPTAMAGPFELIYADATLGSDNNPGTAALPVQTIEKAFALLPQHGANLIGIKFAPGNYTVASPDFNLDKVSAAFPVGFSKIQLLGELTDEVGTKTVTTASANGVFLDATGLSVALHDYEGAVVTITGSAGQATTLNGAITNSATTITVVSTTGFAASGVGSNGYLLIGTEKITYTGKTSTTFTGCVRGAYGTTAASHADLTPVTANQNLNAQSMIRDSSPNLSTTASDNPLTNSATTVNVASTTGFAPSGSIQIESETILYSGVTATSFTGCVRGAYGTTAASHVVTTAVTSHTLEVLVAFPAAINAGDTFTIGKPAVNINFYSMYIHSFMNLRYIKLTCDKSLYTNVNPDVFGQLQLSGYGATMAGCEIDMKLTSNPCRAQFGGQLLTGGGIPSASQPYTYPAGINRLLTTQESGVYVHDAGFQAGAMGILQGYYVLKNVVYQSQNTSYCTMFALASRNTTFTALNDAFMRFTTIGGALGAGIAGNHYNRMSTQQTASATGAIVVSSAEAATFVERCWIIESAGHALKAQDRGFIRAISVIGSNNVGAGAFADFTGYNKIQLADALSTVTGTVGDLKIGSNVLTYAQLSALTSKTYSDDLLNQITLGTATASSRLVAVSQLVAYANISGRNGAGSITLTGAKVGDKVLVASFAKVPTAVAGTQAGLTAFESAVTVADQIQQTGAADLSAEKIDFLLLTP